MELVRGCGYDDVTRSDKSAHTQLRTSDGGIIDFYDQSPRRTVVVRGPADTRARLQAALGPQLEGYAAQMPVVGAQPVFGPGPPPGALIRTETKCSWSTGTTRPRASSWN
jgi:hypothetical protein